MTKQSARNAVLSFLTEEDATTAVEYAVMLALIVLACIGSVGVLSDRTSASFDDSADAITGAFGS
ncbi:Flp family type IVb pilin [Novipirellula aureliae]|nr:Flp family type IVb pilin [Novipirellula aureliae]